MFLVTKEQIKKIAPNINARMLDVLPMYLNEFSLIYELDSPERMAAFLANGAHETGEFNSLRENLNYSAGRIMEVFKKYFKSIQEAQSYAHNSVRLGSRVYANRMGNGNEESGDGYKYRGAGIFHTTGKKNFALLSKHIYGDEKVLLQRPEDVATPIVAVQSAMYYWDSNNLNKYVDANDFRGLVKAINGGYNGITERAKYWERAKEVFGISKLA